MYKFTQVVHKFTQVVHKFTQVFLSPMARHILIRFCDLCISFLVVAVVSVFIV